MVGLHEGPLAPAVRAPSEMQLAKFSEAQCLHGVAGDGRFFILYRYRYIFISFWTLLKDPLEIMFFFSRLPRLILVDDHGWFSWCLPVWSMDGFLPCSLAVEGSSFRFLIISLKREWLPNKLELLLVVCVLNL